MIPRLTRGGASRSLLTAVTALAARSDPHSHTIVSLRQGDAEMDEHAREAGVPVIHEPSSERLRDELARADVVQVDWWNSPELGELLRGPLPELRLAIWCHVGGASAPQVLTPEVVALGDAFVASTPITFDNPAASVAARLDVIPDIADPERVATVARRAHEGFAIGYVGTVDPVKMHPGFADLCAAVDVADARFVVCGTGDGFAAIASRAAELGAARRFDLRGYVRDVAPVLAELDVFGYPLCRGNYGAAELVLQEAMHAGLPPVVLPHGGAATLIEDGVTGFVAADERAYVAAIEALGRDRDLRSRLGSAARDHARRAWSPAAVAQSWADVYADLLERPKRAREPLPPVASGAAAFITGLGDEAAPFRASMDPAGIDEALIADAEIAAVAPIVANSDGGLLDHRRVYPSDPHLRLWSGLALRAQGRNALAAGELAAAMRLGCDPRRAAPALADATEELGHPEVARRARGSIPAGTGGLA